MKKNMIILGAFLSLLMAGFIFYASSIPRSLFPWILRIGLPGVMAVGALYFRSKQENPFPFSPSAKEDRLRLVYFLTALLLGSCALIVFVASYLLPLFLSGIAAATFSGIASALFWQGYVWPLMKKKKTVFRSAVKLTLLQMLFMFAVVFSSMAPLAGMHFLPTSLSFLSIAKLFNGAAFFISLMAGFAVTLFLGALVNYWLVKMQQRTYSVLYPALAYSIPGHIMVSVNLLKQTSHPFAFGGCLLMIFGGLGVFIALYRGSNDKQREIGEAK